MAVTPSERYLTTGDAAHVLGASQSAVTRWADAGRLAFFRTPGGHRRFRMEDVEAFQRAMEGSAA